MGPAGFAPTPVGVNLGLFSRGVRFIDPIKAARQPDTWLRVFEAAVQHQCEVLEDALTVIRQNVSRYAAEDFFPTGESRDELLRFLKPRAGLYARLSEMHDCGLLGQMFPEFQAISWRVVRDFYHKYTVDEHTLLTIRNLERLASACPAGRERFGVARCRISQKPELLVLSLLFHDVGKWKDDDHAIESVRMADHMMTRLHMPVESREVVDFLIKNHLRMSRVAFHRDTEDPEIVKDFAALVGIEERLKLLCLMTVADIEAVSPETLTPWKEELLLAPVRRYVQPPDAQLRRRIDRPASGGPVRSARQPPGRYSGVRNHAVSRGASAPLPAAGEPGGHLSRTSGSRATSTKTMCTSGWSARTRRGS